MLKRSFRKLVMSLGAFAIAFCMVMLPAKAVTPEQAEAALAGQAYSEISKESYELSGGGSVNGDKLFKEETLEDGSASYVIVPEQYDTLSKKGQAKFAKILGRTVEGSYDPNNTDNKIDSGVTKETALQWLKRMTSLAPGLGTQMMLTLTGGMQPDFISAKGFVEPLEGPIGTVVGIIAYIIFLALAIVIISDVAFIGIPTLQNMAGDSSVGKGKFTLFSSDARKAVQEADGSSSKGMILYLKYRLLFFIALAFVMFYLVMGRMYELVGLILDLFSGIAGI